MDTVVEQILISAALVGGLVLLVVVMDRRSARKRAADRERDERSRAQRDALGQEGWERELPALLDAARDALERVGLGAVEAAPREVQLRAWSKLHLRDEPEVLFQGLTGRGERAGYPVTATVSASRGDTFSGERRRVAVLWEIELGSPDAVDVRCSASTNSSTIDWRVAGVSYTSKLEDESPFAQLHEGFEAARDALATAPGVILEPDSFEILKGVFRARLELEYPGADLERLAALGDTIQWEPGWRDLSETQLGFLRRVDPDSPMSPHLLTHRLEDDDTRAAASEVLVERARALHGESLLQMVRLAPELVSRLDRENAVEYVRAMAPREWMRDVGWAVEWLPAERWLELDWAPKQRAEILVALLERGERGERMRAQLSELAEEGLGWQARRSLIECAVSTRNPAMLGAALIWIAREEDMDRQCIDYTLDTLATRPELASGEPGLEQALVDALSHVEGERRLRVMGALGAHGARLAAPTLSRLADGSHLELDAEERRAAEAALAALIERVGEVGDGGLSVAEGASSEGGLNVVAGEDGGLSQLEP